MNEEINWDQFIKAIEIMRTSGSPFMVFLAESMMKETVEWALNESILAKLGKNSAGVAVKWESPS